MRIYDVIIIGAGPAGIGAGLQLRHNGFNPLVIEKNEIGGRIRLARRVENLISSRPISGIEVCKNLNKIVKRKNIEIEFEEVLKIGGFRGYCRVETDKNLWFSHFVVVATGIKPKIPAINGIDNPAIQKFLFYEWRSLKREVHSPVLIIGGGEVGADSACSLKENGFEVTLFSRSIKPKINPVLEEDLRRLGTSLITGITYRRIESYERMVGLIYARKKRRFKVSGRSVLVSTGGIPNVPEIEEDVSADRIFFCGDVKSSNSHQAAIAFGDGVNVAMNISNLILGRKRC